GVGTYRLAHQHLPVARTAEALADLVGMEVSTGWVSGLLPKAKALLDQFLVDLRYRLMASPVMANDESGARIDTARFWFRAATTASLTVITSHRRGGQGRRQDIAVQAPAEGHLHGVRRHRHPGDPGQPRPVAAGPGGAQHARAGVLEPGPGLQGSEGRDPVVLQEPVGVVHLQH